MNNNSIKQQLNFELPIPALDANVYALRFFESLINDNLTPDDIALIASYFDKLVQEHLRINILLNNPDNKVL